MNEWLKAKLHLKDGDHLFRNVGKIIGVEIWVKLIL